MDPAKAEAAITERTRAIIPVHMTGRPVDLEAIGALAKARGLHVIEDAAHAIGGAYNGRPVGSCEFSDMAIYSFHPVKTVTTGEGGAITTNDPELAKRLRQFRDHGMERVAENYERPSPGPWYHEQQDLGHNLRLSAIQCALGTSQLRRLGEFIERRRALAARYDRLLEGHAKVRPIAKGPEGAESAYHLYAVFVDFDAIGISRAEVMQGLRGLRIGTQVHYIPVPMHPYYVAQGEDPSLYPGAMRYYQRELSLPLYPAMRDEDVDRVVAALDQVLGA